MSHNKPQDPAEEPVDPAPTDPDTQEVTLRDGESVSIEVPMGTNPNIVVNVVPPQRSVGFFTSCLQGCGCVALVLLALAFIGSFVR